MARRPQLEVYAQRHGLKLGTIADLIRHRLTTERTVERVTEQPVDTACGRFRLVVWRDTLARQLHHALVLGTPQAETPTLVRVHTRNDWSDVLAIERPDFGTPLRRALARIADAGSGVLVLIGDRPDDEALLARLAGAPHTPDAAPWRTTGIGAQILAELGCRRLRVLGTRRRYLGLAGYGLEVVEYV